jgi:hypothetical protein
MEEEAATTTSTTEEVLCEASNPPVITLLIENPGKGKNWGPLLRCCAAFGIETIYVVGYDKCDVRGSHGASKHVRLVAFPTHEQAAEALTAPNNKQTGGGGFELVGLLSPPLVALGDEATAADDDDDFDMDRAVVRERFFYEAAETELEIVKVAPSEDADRKTRRSFPLHLKKLPKRTCLVVDKLKRGLPWSLARHCSSFVHIPHTNCNPNGSMLTLEASISIVFHEAMNAGWVGHTTSDPNNSNHDNHDNHDNDNNSDTAEYQGQKYHVEKIHKGGNPTDIETRHRKRKEREDKMKELQHEATSAATEQRQSIFGESNDGDY